MRIRWLGRVAALVAAIGVMLVLGAFSATASDSDSAQCGNEYPRGPEGSTCVLDSKDTSAIAGKSGTVTIVSDNDPPSIHDNALLIRTGEASVTWGPSGIGDVPGPESVAGVHTLVLDVVFGDRVTLAVLFGADGVWSADARIADISVTDIPEKISASYACESIAFAYTAGDEPVVVTAYDTHMNPIPDSAFTLSQENPTYSFAIAAGEHWFAAEMNGRTWSIDPVIEPCPKPEPIPATVTVIKQVVNDDGGTATVGHFTLRIDDMVVTSGETTEVVAGTYVVSEKQRLGYTLTDVTINGVTVDISTTQSVTVGEGEDVVVVFVNDDDPPPPPPDPKPKPKPKPKPRPKPGTCVLTVTKAVSQSMALPDDELTYTVEVTNTGTANCTGSGTRLMDVLDANVVFVDARFSHAVAGYGDFAVYDSGTHSVNGNAKTLVPGETATMTIVVRVVGNESTVCSSYVIENIAQATSREYNPKTWHTDAELIWVYSNEVAVSVDADCTSVPDPEPTPEPQPDPKPEREDCPCICIDVDILEELEDKLTQADALLDDAEAKIQRLEDALVRAEAAVSELEKQVETLSELTEKLGNLGGSDADNPSDPDNPSTDMPGDTAPKPPSPTLDDANGFPLWIIPLAAILLVAMFALGSWLGIASERDRTPKQE